MLRMSLVSDADCERGRQLPFSSVAAESCAELDLQGSIRHFIRRMKFRFTCRIVVATVLLSAGFARAALPGNYAETFSELSAMIDGNELSPLEMVRGGWLTPGYFAPAAEGLEFNRARFAAARTAGQAGLSGLFLAVHGRPEHHQFVCKTLETDKTKRAMMNRIFGTEAAFFQSLENGEYLQPLMNALPSTAGPRSLLRLLIQSKDPLVRRAGLFWGHWFADGDYWKSAREMAAKDSDAVNRACAVRLLKHPPLSR